MSHGEPGRLAANHPTAAPSALRHESPPQSGGHRSAISETAMPWCAQAHHLNDKGYRPRMRPRMHELCGSYTAAGSGCALARGSARPVNGRATREREQRLRGLTRRTPYYCLLSADALGWSGTTACPGTPEWAQHGGGCPDAVAAVACAAGRMAGAKRAAVLRPYEGAPPLHPYPPERYPTRNANSLAYSWSTKCR